MFSGVKELYSLSDNIPPFESSKGWKLLSVILVIVIVAESGFVVYSYLGYNSKESSLQTQISSLQQQIQESSSSRYQVAPENVSLSQLYVNVSRSVVVISGLIVNSTGVFTIEGSGFVYNYTGQMVIVTNYHVVDGAVNVTISFSDGDEYRMKSILGYDIYSDLAVLSVNAPLSEFKPLQIVSSSSLSVGDPVIAIGTPYGLAGSMTTGIVSALYRTIPAENSNYSIGDVIQTSTPINPGNSGGPLLNYNGQVVGITTAIVSGSTGVGFAIPSDTILREIGSLITTGSYNQYSYLGILMLDMSYDVAQAMKINYTYGVLLETVTTGGPAYKAGLKGSTTPAVIDGSTINIGGDVIIAVNGTRIIDSDSFISYLIEYTLPNQTIVLTIIRNGLAMNVSVVLGTRPPPT